MRLRRPHALRHRRPGARRARLPGPDLRPRLDHDAAAGRARALAGGRARRARRASRRSATGAATARSSTSGVLLRPEGPLAAPAHRAAGRDRRAASCWRWRSTPTRQSDLAALAAHGWELVDPAEVAGTPAATGGFVAGLEGRRSASPRAATSRRAAAGSAIAASATSPRAGRSSRRRPASPASCPTGEGLFAFETADDGGRGDRRGHRRLRAARRGGPRARRGPLRLRRVLTRLLDHVSSTTAESLPRWVPDADTVPR